MIARIHEESRGTYGWPRVHAELVLGLGEQVNRKRVARLMREAGLQGVYRRKARKNLVNAATEEDFVHRQFHAENLDRLWLTDITEHAAADGKLYCAAVMDAWARQSPNTARQVLAVGLPDRGVPSSASSCHSCPQRVFVSSI